MHTELAQANAFVTMLHRHHKPVTGHRFSIAAYDVENPERGTVGVAIVGRPVARMTDQFNTVEVLRLCSNGDKNVCSFLYGAAARAADALGYFKIQTFILESEPGTSLKAAGWVRGHTTAGGDGWQSRPGRDKTQPTEPKVLWYKVLPSGILDLHRGAGHFISGLMAHKVHFMVAV
jgi:hypothetical protein